MDANQLTQATMSEPKVGLRGQKTIGGGKVDSVAAARDIPADYGRMESGG